MNIATSWSTDSNTETAVAQSYTSLVEQLGETPHFIVVTTSVTYDINQIVATLGRLAPHVAVHGATSCLGAMTQAGFHSADGRGLALWGIHDPDGDYGVAAAEIKPGTGGARLAGREAILAAIDDAGRFGEPPSLIWLTAVPGFEEAIIEGIQDVVGVNVPITGGSSADNDVSGQWAQFTQGAIFSSAVVVSVLYPSRPVHYAFHSGYSLTELTGKVTRAESRTVFEIDGQPAAEVYNAWTGGLLDDLPAGGGNVLELTSLYPLGRRVAATGEMPVYRLAHPDSVTSDGGLTLFANVAEGDELVQMVGTRQSLVSRAGRVAKGALDMGRISAEDICGGLVVYCAGCMLTVVDDMGLVTDSLNQALNNVPFSGMFTFGEQGCFVGGKNHHGNLMISVLVFEK